MKESCIPILEGPMMVKNTMIGGLTPWEIRRAMMGNKGNKGFTSMVGQAADVEVVG